MNGAFILVGRIADLNLVVAPGIADNALFVSQTTYDRIKDAFPEVKYPIKEDYFQKNN